MLQLALILCKFTTPLAMAALAFLPIPIKYLVWFPLLMALIGPSLRLLYLEAWIV